jgi:phosphonate transport system substrate-binding protein
MFRLSVCPHDTAKNLIAWFYFNTYLQKKLNLSIRFEPRNDFIEERNAVLSGGYHIVYANPYSAAIFRKSLGFIPVAKPIDLFDETILVSSAGKSIPNHRPIKVASATDQLIVHILGLYLLRDQNIQLSDCEFVFVGTHQKVAQAVIEGQADIGFIYNETWNGLAEITRKSLAVISESNLKKAYHCFCISPEWSDKVEQIRQILCDMKNDGKGKRVLEDLRFKGFEPIYENDLDQIISMIEELKSLNSYKIHN